MNKKIVGYSFYTNLLYINLDKSSSYIKFYMLTDSCAGEWLPNFAYIPTEYTGFEFIDNLINDLVYRVENIYEEYFRLDQLELTDPLAAPEHLLALAIDGSVLSVRMALTGENIYEFDGARACGSNGVDNLFCDLYNFAKNNEVYLDDDFNYLVITHNDCTASYYASYQY